MAKVGTPVPWKGLSSPTSSELWRLPVHDTCGRTKGMRHSYSSSLQSWPSSHGESCIRDPARIHEPLLDSSPRIYVCRNCLQAHRDISKWTAGQSTGRCDRVGPCQKPHAWEISPLHDAAATWPSLHVQLTLAAARWGIYAAGSSFEQPAEQTWPQYYNAANSHRW